MLNKFLLNFFQNNLSIISIPFNEIDNVKHFLSFLKLKCVVISEEDDVQKIINILIKHNDQNVFISTPINEWILENNNDITKGHSYSKYFKVVRDIIVKNNISLILVNNPYHNFNNNIGIKNSVHYICDYIVSIQSKVLHIEKCRLEKIYDIKLEDLNTFIKKEIRNKKLKRILKQVF